MLKQVQHDKMACSGLQHDKMACSGLTISSLSPLGRGLSFLENTTLGLIYEGGGLYFKNVSELLVIKYGSCGC